MTAACSAHLARRFGRLIARRVAADVARRAPVRPGTPRHRRAMAAARAELAAWDAARLAALGAAGLAARRTRDGLFVARRDGTPRGAPRGAARPLAA